MISALTEIIKYLGLEDKIELSELTQYQIICLLKLYYNSIKQE